MGTPRYPWCAKSSRCQKEALGHKGIAVTVGYARLAPDYQLADVERSAQSIPSLARRVA